MIDGERFSFGGEGMPCDVSDIASVYPELNVWLGKTPYWGDPENWSKGRIPRDLRGFRYLDGIVKDATFGVSDD